MARIVCLAALLAALLAPAAQAGGPAATARALDRQMSKAGIASGAYVIDLDSGRELYARAPDVARIPASVNKLLHHLRRPAAVRRRGPADDRGARRPRAIEDGVLRGDLYLRGGGDPSFSRAQARGLARVLAGSGLLRVDRARDRRRVALRRPARRPGLELRDVHLGRPAQRPAVQPRHDARPPPDVPARARPLRRRALRQRARARRRQRPPRGAQRGRAGRQRCCWASGRPRGCRCWSATPTARPTTTWPRRC